jgi:arabinose-5-phosphate isomerase
MSQHHHEQTLATARAALAAEAEAVRVAATRLDRHFVGAVELLHTHPGKVIVSGVGKSGDIGRKIASTLRSIGKPAVFMSAADATHGDLGLYHPGDPTILLSKSGVTPELVQLLPQLERIGSPLIAIVGNLQSPLARAARFVIDARVSEEADHLNAAPTCSTTVAVALGDALAVALMRLSAIDHQEFASYHPSGQLGRNLTMRVADAMQPAAKVATVHATDSLQTVVIAMTTHALGAACVISTDGVLEGLITDGDLRRALQRHPDIRELKAADLMTARPTTTSPAALLKEAAALMENRPSQISVLPVVDDERRCVGLLRIHDLYWH